jgi:hypothetical protein
MAADTRTVLTVVAARVMEQLPELGQRIVSLIVAHEPTYQAAGAVPMEVLTSSVEANMRQILQSLAGVRRSTEEELAVARTTGRRRAQQGVPLEAVLRAYRLATQLMLDALVAEVHGTPQQDLTFFVEVATAVLEVMDRHSEAVVEGYRRTEEELRHRDAQRRQATFDALLEGRGGDPQTAGAALAALGLPVIGSYAVVVAAFDVAAQHTFSAARDACAAYAFTAAWRTRGDREIGLVALGRSAVPRLAEALRRHTVGRVGVSDPFEAMHEMPAAHRWAELAVQTIPRGASEVAWIAERLPEALVVSSPALAERLARAAFGPLLDLPADERGVLLETLAAWYESGRSAARAGRLLYCHRNTILNRLHRIEHLTGGSWEDPRFLLDCHLALLTLRLLPSSVV